MDSCITGSFNVKGLLSSWAPGISLATSGFLLAHSYFIAHLHPMSNLPRPTQYYMHFTCMYIKYTCTLQRYAFCKQKYMCK